MNSKQSLLIVEEDKGFRNFLVQLFHKEYAIKAAENAIKALQCLHQGNLPQLLIIDLSLPDISGAELVHQIKTNGITRDIPIIVLCKESHEEQGRTIAEYAQKLIIKPFDPEELKAEVQRVLSF
ncbi:MAG: response regulator [Bacteroidota bacterium]